MNGDNVAALRPQPTTTYHNLSDKRRSGCLAGSFSEVPITKRAFEVLPKMPPWVAYAYWPISGKYIVTCVFKTVSVSEKLALNMYEALDLHVNCAAAS